MSTRISPCAIAATMLAIALLLPTASAAAATTATNYRLDAVRYSSGTAVGTCRGWGADADAAGNFYMACPVMRDVNGDGIGDYQAPALYEMNSTGTVVRIGWLPAEYAFDTRYPIRDVGVAPDGKTAYVSVGPNLDNLGQHPEINQTTKQVMANGATAGSLLRLVRQADGSWAYDPTFKAGPFSLGGNYWAVRYVDVDASGRIYVSVNSYVYELSPQTGAIVSAFGGAQTRWPGGPWVEGFDKPEGLAVSADGNSIWIVDQQHQIVQRWRRVGATDWVRDTTILLGTPDEIGDYCTTTDHFQSPYDVGVDGAGDVYVLDTTCQRIQRFTATGQFVQTVWTNTGGDDFNHGFGVSWQGSIVLPIEEDLLVRLDPPDRPASAAGGGGICVDKTPPTITAIASVRRSSTRRIHVRVTGKDDCGITHVAITGNRLGRAAWVAGTEASVSLSGWNGRKTLLVSVRDAKGRAASRRILVTLALPQPQLRVRPRTVMLMGGSCTRIAPSRRIGTHYIVVDRCARISGRITAIRTGRMFQVLIPTRQARSIYTNAVGPVRMWVVTDSLTRHHARARVGRYATIDAVISAERSHTAAYAMPADRVTIR